MIAPLSRTLWIESLTTLANKVERRTTSAEQATRLLYYLVQLTPPEFKSVGSPDLTDKQFEKILRKQGPISALGCVLPDEIFQIEGAQGVARSEPRKNVRLFANDDDSQLSAEPETVLLAALENLKALLEINRH